MFFFTVPEERSHGIFPNPTVDSKKFECGPGTSFDGLRLWGRRKAIFQLSGFCCIEAMNLSPFTKGLIFSRNSCTSCSYVVDTWALKGFMYVPYNYMGASERSEEGQRRMVSEPPKLLA